ncbi:hypothetical protein [Sulfurimonas sp. HSL-1716]|uniref:hypothetical protein n=1 Tax=Hydrocurvibacter sulfurireducens TaxID=3131937 RepID=UPI0031F75747
MKKLFLLFLCLINLYAQNDYDVRVAYGRADANDFGQIISSQIAPHHASTHVMMVDAGYKIAENVFDLPFDIYIKGGFAKFLENGYQKDVYENTLYFKGYYNFDFSQNRVRFGAAEGASYTYGIIYIEKEEATRNRDNNSNYLNYLELSLDFDIGRLLKYKPLKDTYFGVVLKHRSGVFGLVNNVRHGGSNYEALYIEKNF